MTDPERFKLMNTERISIAALHDDAGRFQGFSAHTDTLGWAGHGQTVEAALEAIAREIERERAGRQGRLI
jgi:hypothetical protein